MLERAHSLEMEAWILLEFGLELLANPAASRLILNPPSLTLSTAVTVFKAADHGPGSSRVPLKLFSSRNPARRVLLTTWLKGIWNLPRKHVLNPNASTTLIPRMCFRGRKWAWTVDASLWNKQEIITGAVKISVSHHNQTGLLSHNFYSQQAEHFTRKLLLTRVKLVFHEILSVNSVRIKVHITLEFLLSARLLFSAGLRNLMALLVLDCYGWFWLRHRN